MPSDTAVSPSDSPPFSVPGVIPIDWRVRFVLPCTTMALIEEVTTTTMTNLASVCES